MSKHNKLATLRHCISNLTAYTILWILNFQSVASDGPKIPPSKILMTLFLFYLFIFNQLVKRCFSFRQVARAVVCLKLTVLKLTDGLNWGGDEKRYTLGLGDL